MIIRSIIAQSAGLVLAVTMLVGCEDGGSESDTNPNAATKTPETSATGVVPSLGTYGFSCRLQGYWNLSIHFRVQEGTSSTQQVISFSMDGYAFYGIPVNNGRFYYVNGLWWGTPSDSGNAYPTDGFAISGHFVSSDRAEGTISYDGTSYSNTDESFFDGAPFTAER